MAGASIASLKVSLDFNIDAISLGNNSSVNAGRFTIVSIRGKEHEVPVYSKAKEAIDLWLECSHLASNSSVPLFPSFGKNRETIESRRLDRRSVLKLVEKRAKASGILKRVCCHSFRATGVTEYMNSGGTIEIAQRIAGHTSPATTRIYDRSGDRHLKR
jgi:integrase/recombinase XerD